MRDWGVINKMQAPQLGCLVGTWSASTPEESEDQKRFGRATTVVGFGEEEGPGGLLGNWVRDCSPLLGRPSPSALAGRGPPDAPGRGLEGLTAACPAGR